MKLLTLYERRGAAFIHNNMQVSSARWTICPPIFKVENYKDNNFKLGELIKDCLFSQRNEVDENYDYRTALKSLLDMAGVRSFSRFSEGAKCVDIEAHDQTIKLRPRRNEGGGFVPMSPDVIIEASVADVCEKAIEAIKLSEFRGPARGRKN